MNEEIKLQKVSSSAIKAIGYKDNSLYILFHNTGLYRYKNVPEILYNQLQEAPSIGKFYNQRIKPEYPNDKFFNPAQVKIILTLQ